MTPANLLSRLTEGTVRNLAMVALVTVTAAIACAWVYATLQSVEASSVALQAEAWEDAANRFEAVAQQLFNIVLVATGVKGGMVFERKRNGT